MRSSTSRAGATSAPFDRTDDVAQIETTGQPGEARPGQAMEHHPTLSCGRETATTQTPGHRMGHLTLGAPATSSPIVTGTAIAIRRYGRPTPAWRRRLLAADV